MATTQEDYYAEFENRSTGPSELGENRFISLEDIINNYMVLYVDSDNHGNVSRTKVEAFAQRGIQEYSYDTFKVKTWEYEVIDRATFPMPQDFVELVGMNYVDERGIERWVHPRRNSSNPRSPLQFDNTPVWDEETTYSNVGDYVKYNPTPEISDLPKDYYVYRLTLAAPAGTLPTDTMYWSEEQVGLTGYVYNSDGDIIFFENSSYTNEQYNETHRRQTLLGGNLSDGTHRAQGYGYYGKRYYSAGGDLNANPSYYINDRDGVIDLDPVLIGEVINLTYVSDGLSSDLSEVKVHKFAEQALYEFIYFEMIARSSKIPANEKQRAQRRMFAKKREAKLRLMNLSPRDMIQILRDQSKWIKT